MLIKNFTTVFLRKYIHKMFTLFYSDRTAGILMYEMYPQK